MTFYRFTQCHTGDSITAASKCKMGKIRTQIYLKIIEAMEIEVIEMEIFERKTHLIWSQ